MAQAFQLYSHQQSTRTTGSGSGSGLIQASLLLKEAPPPFSHTDHVMMMILMVVKMMRKMW
eukprot:11953317-Karenia_brevis.AAC.1